MRFTLKKLLFLYIADNQVLRRQRIFNCQSQDHYWILCKVQKTIGGLEQFASVPRHRFVEHLRVRNLDNSFTDYYGVYTCGFKIDFEEYDAFIESTDEEAKRTIARKVVESLANLDNLSKKAAGFDKDRFKADVIRLFQKYDLL